MATLEKAPREVEHCRCLLQGSAKNLADRLYGDAGPSWGTPFAHLERTAVRLGCAVRKHFLHLVLSRQAATFLAAPPPAHCLCPCCGRPTVEAEPEPRILRSRAGGDAEALGTGPLNSSGPATTLRASTSSARSVVARALGYLENNRGKMNDATYRRRGLPIVSSLVESMVKQISRRVKGTEKFWTDEGAEAILQLRADYLSDGEVVADFWQRRQEAATGQRCYRPRS